jgi:hypothetical protein
MGLAPSRLRGDARGSDGRFQGAVGRLIHLRFAPKSGLSTAKSYFLRKEPCGDASYEQCNSYDCPILDCYPQQGDIALQKIEECIHAAKLYQLFWIKISYFSSLDYGHTRLLAAAVLSAAR